MGLNWTRKFERATCPICGRRISAWVPHFGDGSDVKLVRHNERRAPRGMHCSGSDRMLGELRRETETAAMKFPMDKRVMVCGFRRGTVKVIASFEDLARAIDVATRVRELAGGAFVCDAQAIDCVRYDVLAAQRDDERPRRTRTR